MKFISIRDLRNDTAGLRRDLQADREIVVTANGRPIAIMTRVDPDTVELPDPDDAAFLEVAAASGSILITGNTRHYPKSSQAEVPVMTPSEFLELLCGSRS